ncbi:hypothetical protein PLCT2_00095 [Planctomycetaceae bacterium]|nr:hypothetical protein PLCT2_00095 [Planctomycetaceae bacterium]
MDPRIETRKDLYEDGALEAERVVRIDADGSEVNHGTYVRWHQNGLKAEEGQFEDGKPVGRWRRWLETGQNFFDGDYLEAEQPAEPLPDSGPIAPETEDDEPAVFNPRAATADRRTLWFEMLLVLGVFWLPSMLWAIAWLVGPPHTLGSFATGELLQVGSSLGGIALFFLLVLRSGDKPSGFGLSKPMYILDPMLALVIFLFDWLMSGRIALFFQDFFAHYTTQGPASGLDWSLLVFALACNSVAEETIMRGYLMKRLHSLTGSLAATLLVPAALFASYHAYGGLGHVVCTFFIGIVYGIVFRLTQRLWPLILAHTAYNIALYATAY